CGRLDDHPARNSADTRPTLYGKYNLFGNAFASQRFYASPSGCLWLSNQVTISGQQKRRYRPSFIAGSLSRLLALVFSYTQVGCTFSRSATSCTVRISSSIWSAILIPQVGFDFICMSLLSV